MSPQPVVVAVSPSSGSSAALTWAEQEAARRGAPLQAVMVLRYQRTANGSDARGQAGLDTVDDAEAARLLARLVRQAVDDPQAIEQSVLRGATAASIAIAAESAQLLVLGAPAKERIAGARATLIAPQLVYRTSCPVVVMPLLERSPVVAQA